MATGLYVYYASGQLKAIQGQLEQMKASSAQTDKLVIAAQTSASVSLDALNLARKNFLADERPYVFTNAVIPEPSSPRDAQGHFAAGSRLSWRVDFNNYGRSPAINLIIKAGLFHGLRALEEADNYFQQLPTALTGPVLILPPGGPPSVDQSFTTVVSLLPLSADEIAFIYSHDFAIVVVGRFQYQDTSGTPYWTDFCTSTFITGPSTLAQSTMKFTRRIK